MTSINKTDTPELTPEALDRLRDNAELFRDDFRYKVEHSWSGVYLRGLLQVGERTSFEPMVARVPGPRNSSTSRIPSRPCSNSSTRAPGMSRRFGGAIAA